MGDVISGGGFADVFDQQGRLVRHYTAVERANTSWEIMELMRLPTGNVPRVNREKSGSGLANLGR